MPDTPQELSEILRALRALDDEGFVSGAALATIVRTVGSTFRRAGTRMLVYADGHVVRGLSGGCPERDITERARQVIASGQAQIARYNRDSSLDVLIEMGCGGELDVLIEPVTRDTDLNFVDAIVQAHRRRVPSWLATAFARDSACLLPGPVHRVWSDNADSDDDIQAPPVADEAAIGGATRTEAGAVALIDAVEFERADAAAAADAAVVAAALEHAARDGHSFEAAALEIAAGVRGRDTAVRTSLRRVNAGTGSYDVLVERLRPPHALVVIGVNAGALALARQALNLGWLATVVDHRADARAPANLPAGATFATAAPEFVRARIAFDHDTSVVVMSHVMDRDLAYLAALRDAPVGYLGAIGSRERAARLHAAFELPAPRLYAPAGLDIGSETPEEIAMAIAAEILAVRAGRDGAPLSAGEDPIH